MIPNWDEFTEYLLYQVGRSIDSGIKARFFFIQTYFTDKSFTIEEVRHMVAYLKQGNKGCILSNDTINKYIQTVRHIARYNNISFMDRYKDLPPDAVKKTRYILTAHQYTTLLQCSIPRNTPHGISKRNRSQYEYITSTRYNAIIATLIYTGMRPQELCDLTWEQYTGLVFYIYKTKTHTPRTVIIPKALRPYLDKLQHFPHNYIFGGIRGKLKPETINEELTARCIKCSLPRLTAYDFRASFVNNCIDNGGESTLPRIAQNSGHSIQTLYKYYLQHNTKKVRDTIEATHPLLKGHQDIDGIKRVLVDQASTLIGSSPYEIEITIKKKERYNRHVILS